MSYGIILFCGLLLAVVVWFSIFFVIIHIAVAGLKFTLDDYNYAYNYDQQIIISAALINVVGYQFAVICSNIFARRLIAKNLRQAEYQRTHI